MIITSTKIDKNNLSYVIFMIRVWQSLTMNLEQLRKWRYSCSEPRPALTAPLTFHSFMISAHTVVIMIQDGSVSRRKGTSGRA